MQGVVTSYGQEHAVSLRIFMVKKRTMKQKMR
jgi:hypothetical protein